jgi:hypothetical protein
MFFDPCRVPLGDITRLYQRLCWHLQFLDGLCKTRPSCELLRRVVWWKFNNISEVLVACIIRAIVTTVNVLTVFMSKPHLCIYFANSERATVKVCPQYAPRSPHHLKIQFSEELWMSCHICKFKSCFVFGKPGVKISAQKLTVLINVFHGFPHYLGGKGKVRLRTALNGVELVRRPHEQESPRQWIIWFNLI